MRFDRPARRSGELAPRGDEQAGAGSHRAPRGRRPSRHGRPGSRNKHRAIRSGRPGNKHRAIRSALLRGPVRPGLLLLTGAVALVAVLPLAGAFAGPLGKGAQPPAGRDGRGFVRGGGALREGGAVPEGPGGRDAAAVREGADAPDGAAVRPGGAPGDVDGGDARGDAGAVRPDPPTGQDDGAPQTDAPGDGARRSLPSGAGPVGGIAQCGPELSSPDGIEAQTCVMTRDGDTWGRTYFRNATGRPLSSVLTLMGPHDRTLQIRCDVDAADDPGVCETPRERTAGPADAYAAVAEFAAPRAARNGGGTGPLLLRTGSGTGRVAGPDGGRAARAGATGRGGPVAASRH
ncbi:hypothetical protein ACWCP6_08970 [Streptomyces sp. NPDC002004]